MIQSLILDSIPRLGIQSLCFPALDLASWPSSPNLQAFGTQQHMSGTCHTVAHHFRIYSQTIQTLYTTIPTFPKFPMQAWVPKNPESLGHGRNISEARSIMPHKPPSLSQNHLVPSAPYIQNHTLSFDLTTIPWVLGLCPKTLNLGMLSLGLLPKKLGLWPNSLGILDFGPIALGSHYPWHQAWYIITYSLSSQNPNPLLGPTITPQVQTLTRFWDSGVI